MTQSTLAVLLGALAGALGALGAFEVARTALDAVGARRVEIERALSRWVEENARHLWLPSGEHTGPADRERLRLQGAAAAGAALLGFLAVGPRFAVAAGVLAPWAVARSLQWSREQYRRQLDAGAAAAAEALADGLDAGRSLRGALQAAPEVVPGAFGAELSRVARELDLGARTESALRDLRKRARSRRVDLIAAAAAVHRRSGGNLARLLRDIAASIEEQDRLSEEARAASSQARFTAGLVVAMPMAAMVLGELLSPGLAARTLGSPGGTWLVLCAVALQVTGVGLVRRFSRAVV